MDWRHVVVAGLVDLRAELEEEVDDLDVGVPGRVVQRRELLLVEVVDPLPELLALEPREVPERVHVAISRDLKGNSL